MAASPPQEPMLSFDLVRARRRLLLWYRKQNRSLPWRTLHAKTQSPYPVWISEIMLQQTVIKAVIPKFENFMRQYPTVKALAQTTEEELRRAVAGLGYYRRFANLHKAAKALVAKRPFLWPQSAAAWRELPGIGAYTGNAIASIAFNEPVAVVDGNVERVFCRLLDWRIAPSPKHKPAMQRLADQLLARKSPGEFNQAVMELGQLVCTKGTPQCHQCPLAEFCLATKNQSWDQAPQPKQRRQAVPVHMTLGLIRRQRQVLLIRRPEQAKFLKGAWGFPTFLQGNDGCLQADGFETETCHQMKTLATIQHGITHHKITAHLCQLPRTHFDKVEQTWVDESDVEGHLVASLDKKAWRQIARES